FTAREAAMTGDRVTRAFDADSFRRAGVALVEQLAEYFARATRGDIPVIDWQPPAARVAAWPSSFPREPADERATRDFFARALAEAIHIHHPRFVGHQVTSPAPLGALAELVSALLNNGMAVYEMGPGGTAMERSVVRFFCD